MILRVVGDGKIILEIQAPDFQRAFLALCDVSGDRSAALDSYVPSQLAAAA